MQCRHLWSGFRLLVRIRTFLEQLVRIWSGIWFQNPDLVRIWSGKPVFTLQSCRPAVELSMVIRAQNIYFWALIIFIVQNPDFGPDFQILVRILVYFWSGFGTDFNWKLVRIWSGISKFWSGKLSVGTALPSDPSPQAWKQIQVIFPPL